MSCDANVTKCKHPHKRCHSLEKLSQELTWKIIRFIAEYTHAEMENHKRETYNIEPRTHVVFMFKLDDECKIIIKKLKKYVFGCQLVWVDKKVAANNIFL